MLPFSKRPPPPDEYLLRSGDLECASPVQQGPYSYAPPPSYGQHQHVQHAPPPAFVRQAPQAAYGFTQNSYAQRNDLSAPPPPHSLAPMAMSADSTSRQMSTTGVSRSHNGTMSGRDKPSLKWGIMIALSGALLGGVLGLGMDARRQSARAAAAAEAQEAAPPTAVVAAAQPVQPVVLAPRVAVAVAPPVAVARPVAVAPAVIAPAVIAPAVIAPPAVVLGIAPSVVVPKGHARSFAKPHGFLAAKVTAPSRPEPKAEAPEPKSAKADKPEAPKPVVKRDSNTSDAMKILEAANKDTTNTL